jgi:hypothetical protein
MKNQRLLATLSAICLLLSTVLAPVARAQDQAPKLRDREEHSANEIAGSEFVAIKPQIISSATLDLGILRMESTGGVAATPSVRQSLPLLNMPGFVGTLSRPGFPTGAVRDFRLPQPQTPSGKKSKAGGLAQGLFGLALAGGGWYLAAKSEPHEIVTPGFTFCTGAMGNGCVKTLPRRTKTGVNLGMFAGIGLVGFGVGVAIAGFRRM